MASKKKTQNVLSTPTVEKITVVPKKRTGHKSSVKKVAVKKTMVLPALTEELAMDEKTPVSVEIPSTVQRVVFIHRCTHCQHVPFGVNVLFTLCFVLMAILSTVLLYSIGGLSLSFAAQSASGTETVTLHNP